MTGIVMRSHELPLLGSNQDSPDPESDEHRLSGVVAGVISGGNTPEARPKPHENPHDSPHTVTRTCSRCGKVREHGTRVRRGRRQAQPYCRPCMVEYHAEWRHGDGRAKFAVKQAASKARYPDRDRARRLLRDAVAAGTVERGTACEFEGSDCSGILEAHHDDYAKPLEVRWVCRGHHRRLDRARREIERRASSALEQRWGGGERGGLAS